MTDTPLAVNPAHNRSAGAQAAACRQAAAFYSARSGGPKPLSREAVFLAALLDEAERTLRLVDKYADEFARVVRGSER